MSARIAAAARRLGALTLAALAALSAGCTVGPNFTAPVVPAPAAFGDEPGDVASRTFGGAVDTAWWRRFDDAELTSLVERLGRQNLDLQSASERILQARAQRRVAASAGLPSIDGAAKYMRERESLNGPEVSNVLPSPRAQLEFNEYQPQLTASWEIDLFGRVRRSVEAADATLQARVEDRRAIALSAIAELAQDYLQLRQAQLQEQIVRSNIVAVQHRGVLVKQRIAAGAVGALDLAQNDVQVSTIQQNLPDLLAQEAQLTNAIGLLLAEPPRALAAELAKEAGRQPPPPPLVPVGLPSELARRRPDVREAEANLHAATAQTGVAVADFYPSVSLTGQVGYDSLHLDSLFDAASRAFMISPTVSLPIFHGGELKGTLELRRSQQREAALAYRKTVLQAWRDVDDALTAYARAQQTREGAVATNAANKRALGLAEQQYRAGASDYLNVLSAQATLFATQNTVAQADARVETSLVALYKALGGGWDA